MQNRKLKNDKAKDILTSFLGHYNVSKPSPTSLLANPLPTPWSITTVCKTSLFQEGKLEGKEFNGAQGKGCLLSVRPLNALNKYANTTGDDHMIWQRAQTSWSTLSLAANYPELHRSSQLNFTSLPQGLHD